MPELAINGGTPVRGTPFPAWPMHDQREVDAVVEVVKSGQWGGNFEAAPGFKADEFAARFAAAQDAQYGIAVMNGTATLEVALRAAGVGPGDEVIVPPITWIATASAPLYLDAVPVFADVDPQTGSLDAAAVEAAITDRTRAVIPVHLGGRPADLDAILEVARRHNLVVIEDAAHAHGARWCDRGIGSWGDFGSFSFQITKVMTSGEGGLLLTNEKRYEELCTALVNCGRLRPGDTLTEHPWGWNYRMTELQGALLLAQFSRLEELTARRAENAAYLERRLREMDGPVAPLPSDPRITRQAYYYLGLRYRPERAGGRASASRPRSRPRVSRWAGARPSCTGTRCSSPPRRRVPWSPGWSAAASTSRRSRVPTPSASPPRPAWVSRSTPCSARGRTSTT